MSGALRSGPGVAGWLMTVIADDAHLNRPLLSVTSSAIFVNNRSCMAARFV
jgi:hypothetical protein